MYIFPYVLLTCCYHKSGVQTFKYDRNTTTNFFFCIETYCLKYSNQKYISVKTTG